MGRPSMIHDRTPDCHPVLWAWMTSQVNVTLIRKLSGSLMSLDYLMTCYSWGFVQPGTGRRPVDWCRNYVAVRTAHMLELHIGNPPVIQKLSKNSHSDIFVNFCFKSTFFCKRKYHRSRLKFRVVL